MNLRARPTIVLLGMITQFPVGGLIWQTAQYLVGFQRLGFNVVYVEEHGMFPGMFAEASDPLGSRRAAAFLSATMERFGLGGSWSYRPVETGRESYGLSLGASEAAFARAAAVVNLSGATLPRPSHRAAGPFIYLETDPVAPQIELHNGVKATEEFLDAHTAYFTFGENLGAADCGVPRPPVRFHFHPTRQPILLDFWSSTDIQMAECFTTVANWRQPERVMTLDGEVYHWSKHHEFLRFIDLPQRTSQPFELALSSYETSDRAMLEAHGWRVRRALDFTGDVDAYRDYILGSRGEWTVAKDQNVRLRSGWFSDRAATYLAAGRPVVTQETGFSNILPTGCGLFAFSTMEETLGAIETINADHSAQARGAREIAREYFDADVVLPALLSEAGVTLPARG